jgi:alkylation response protein AidB-like acyl-CoA dehydrogenase
MVRPLRQMTGHSHFSEVFFDCVRIPQQNLVGAPGAGWTVAATTLKSERLAIGGVDPMASFRPLLELCSAHPERVDAVLKDELIKLYTWVRTLELLGARAMTRLSEPGASEGKPAVEGSLMKLCLARIRTKEAELGLRLLGPEGLLRAGSFQDKFLAAPSLHIAGGSDEIQKNILAERVLGLPRDPLHG